MGRPDVTSNQSALSTVLSQDPDDHALFMPGTQYTVEVTWRAASVQSDAAPGAGVTPSFGSNTTQRFRFTADGVDRAPDDLGPWLLATAPGHGETGVFRKRADPRRARRRRSVAALFDAYGEELLVVVHAASGKHPPPPGRFARLGLRHPAGGRRRAPQGASSVLHRHDAVGGGRPRGGRRAGSASTVSAPHDHHVLELPYDFEPLTDYLLDIHAVPSGGSATHENLVHRVPFTTGRFMGEGQLAELVRTAAWEHAVVTNPAALAALGERPTGDQLDVAFQAAGLPAPQAPSLPLVQVLWNTAAVPEPVAVVVEGAEPLWRTRDLPAVVPGPPDASDPSHHWWAARPQEWLTLEVSGAVARCRPPR